MPHKNRNYKIYSIKAIIIILAISSFLIPIIFGNKEFNVELSNYEISPLLNNTSKEEFNPILTVEKHSLGNITINDIDLSNLEMGFFLYNQAYPLLKQDYESGAYIITRTDFNFIETIEPAIQDNLNENIRDNNIITVKLNETLEVNYNNPQAGYLIYLSRLRPSSLHKFYVNNGTNTIELNENTDYTFDTRKFIIFNYKTYFHKGPIFNFKMYLIWEYDLTVESWGLSQSPGQELVIKNIAQNFTVNFNYGFNLLGTKFGKTLIENNVEADNIEVALTINLPDKKDLHGHSLSLNEISVNIGTHLNIDKSVDILLSDHFLANNSFASLNFSSDFSFKFVNSVENTWAIDRLASMKDIRERIFLPSIIAGPKHIYVMNLTLYENTIFIDQVLRSSSQFKRNVLYFFVNNSLTGKEGIKIKFPYLILGETCPSIITYISDQTLRIIVTDNIKMPLVGAGLSIFYYGVEYGTYMSNDNSQPIPPGATNEHGEIILYHVPHGNYTIRVYYNSIFVKESIVSTTKNINYINTNYPHFPLWIMTFGLINGVIILFGVIIYFKNKKKR